jgi:hypothetical protein
LTENKHTRSFHGLDAAPALHGIHGGVLSVEVFPESSGFNATDRSGHLTYVQAGHDLFLSARGGDGENGGIGGDGQIGIRGSPGQDATRYSEATVSSSY